MSLLAVQQANTEICCYLVVTVWLSGSFPMFFCVCVIHFVRICFLFVFDYWLAVVMYIVHHSHSSQLNFHSSSVNTTFLCHSFAFAVLIIAADRTKRTNKT